jgi:hypothetical protein
MDHNPSLADIFTPDQQKQLAILIAELMALGHGSLEITVVDHRPKFFSSKRSYRAVPVDDQSEINGNARNSSGG